MFSQYTFHIPTTYPLDSPSHTHYRNLPSLYTLSTHPLPPLLSPFTSHSLLPLCYHQTKATGPSHYPSTTTSTASTAGAVEVYRLVDLMSDFHTRNTKKVDLLSSTSTTGGAGHSHPHPFQRGQDPQVPQVTHRTGVWCVEPFVNTPHTLIYYIPDIPFQTLPIAGVLLLPLTSFTDTIYPSLFPPFSSCESLGPFGRIRTFPSRCQSLS